LHSQGWVDTLDDVLLNAGWQEEDTVDPMGKTTTPIYRQPPAELPLVLLLLA